MEKLIRRRRASFAPAVLGTFLALTPAVHAQETSGASADSGWGDIIVTAQRREESSQTVPIALTAIGAADLRAAQITDVRALQHAAPGLNLQSSVGDRSAIAASIRGLYLSDSIVTLDPAVGFYLNGVYLARTVGLNQGLVDIGRVEVLRGPQGTLYGRNTIGGAVNIVPNEPEDEIGGEISASLGTYSTFTGTAIVNAPLTEWAAFRVAYQHSEHDGYGVNSLRREPLGNDNSEFVRASLKLESGSFKALIVGDLGELDGGPQMSRIYFARPCGPTGRANCLPALSGNPDDTLENYTGLPFYDARGGIGGGFETVNRGVSATLTWDFGGVTAKSITAWRKLRRTIDQIDVDGTPYVVLDTLFNEQKQRQFSQELQLLGNGLDERLEWILGAYYFTEKASDMSSASNLFPFSMAVPNITDATVHNKSYAGYAQATFEPVDSLRVTAGLRYSKDTRDLISRNRFGPAETCALAPDLLDVPGVCQASLPKRSFDYWPWTVGVDWQANDAILVYAKVSRGFRSGGYNLRGSNMASLDPFGPEQATSFEAGFKGTLLDQLLRINAALYHTDYDDIHLNTLTAFGTIALSRTENAGKARIRGAELEITLMPAKGLRLSASGSITDPEYTELNPGATASLDDRFQGVPKYTYGLVGDYRRAMPGGSVALHVDWSWRSRVYQSQNRAASTAPYGLLNARAAFGVDALEGFEFSLWARNITNRKYYTRSLDFTGSVHGVIIGFPGDPRTYGAGISYKF